MIIFLILMNSTNHLLCNSSENSEKRLLDEREHIRNCYKQHKAQKYSVLNHIRQCKV